MKGRNECAVSTGGYVKILPGSFSGRGGKAWSVQYEVEQARAAAEAFAVSQAGVSNPSVPPSITALRRSVEANTCPFCECGPFKNLGLHTNITHGVSAQELRTLSGLKQICSVDLSDNARELLMSRPDFRELRAKATASSLASALEAGRPSAGSLMHEINAARFEIRFKARDEQICQMAESGARLIDIASEMDTTLRIVRAAITRLGATPTLKQTNSERRARLAKHRETALSSRRANLERRWLEIFGQFTSLGANWEALLAVASEHGKSINRMRAYFTDHGVNMPDGRKESPKRFGKRKPVYENKQCSDQDCLRSAICRGLCAMHYQRLLKSKRSTL